MHTVQFLGGLHDWSDVPCVSKHCVQYCTDTTETRFAHIQSDIQICTVAHIYKTKLETPHNATYGQRKILGQPKLGQPILKF